MSALKEAAPTRVSFMKKAGLYRVRIDDVRDLPALRPRQRALTVVDEEVELSNPMRKVRVVVEYTCLEGEFEGQQFAAMYTRAVYVEQLLKELALVDLEECFLNVHASDRTRTGATIYIHSWWSLRLRQVLKNFVPY